MSPKPTAKSSLLLIWIGQSFSMIGTQMAHFAFLIWAWENSERATPLALLAFFMFAPMIIFSSAARLWIDRWNRKGVMVVSNVVFGLFAAVVLILILMDALEIWHLYLASLSSGIFSMLQWAAVSSAIPLLVFKKQSMNASRMLSLTRSGVSIIAPVLAGYLIPLIGMVGILAINLVSCMVALGMLFPVIISEPQPKRHDNKAGSSFREFQVELKCLFRNKPHLYLELVLFFVSLFFGVAYTVIDPMLLAMTQGNTIALGSMKSVGAIGGLAGSILLTMWGGPKKKIHGVLIGWMIIGILGLGVMGVGRRLPLWFAAHFMMMFIMPIIKKSHQSIWRIGKTHKVQGNELFTQQIIAEISVPLSMVIAGPLADTVFEPGLSSSGSWLSRFLSSIFQSGAGSGMSALIFISGILVAAVGIGAYQIKNILFVKK